MRLFSRIRIRWWMFGFAFAFALLNFMLRTSVAVAAEAIVKDLHITQLQIGLLNTAFMTCYTLMQIPAGALGARYGARATFIVVGIVGLAATLATPLAPILFQGATVFVALLMAQAILGISQSPVFPITAALIEAWFPPHRWAFALGLQSSGMLLGGAVTPILIVAATQAIGWHGALLTTAIPVVAVFALWTWYGRNRPQEHPSVTPAELAELPERASEPAPLTWKRLQAILADRRVLALAVSYLCMEYTFYLLTYWSFLYLVQVRHFTGITSGIAGMLPWVGAMIGATVGGVLTGRAVRHLGPQRGYRLLPLISLPLVAVLLMVTMSVTSAWAAVWGLAAAFAAVELNEGAYWAATMHIAREDTGAAAGALNTGGNAGGILCQPVVVLMTAGGSWTGAFATGAVLAIVAAALWLPVRFERDAGPRVLTIA